MKNSIFKVLEFIRDKTTSLTKDLILFRDYRDLTNLRPSFCLKFVILFIVAMAMKLTLNIKIVEQNVSKNNPFGISELDTRYVANALQIRHV